VALIHDAEHLGVDDAGYLLAEGLLCAVTTLSSEIGVLAGRAGSSPASRSFPIFEVHMQNRALGPGTPTESALLTPKAQTSNHCILGTGIKMRSNQYTAPRQDTEAGGGVSGVKAPGLLEEPRSA
jgi:hypothetical protein